MRDRHGHVTVEKLLQEAEQNTITKRGFGKIEFKGEQQKYLI